MRIVAGKFRGRALATPEDGDIRPTSDRVREALFNILAHAPDIPPLEGAHVLDLFAGTGALGLEALSRGAAYCVFVEHSATARGLLRTNIETLGLTGVTKIYRRDATMLGDAGPREQFDVLLADPPYGRGLGEVALRAAADGGWLQPGALAVVEERSRVAFAWPDAFVAFDSRRWGDTTVHFARYRGTLGAGAPTS